jgi:hypothetical protein
VLVCPSLIPYDLIGVRTLDDPIKWVPATVYKIEELKEFSAPTKGLKDIRTSKDPMYLRIIMSRDHFDTLLRTCDVHLAAGTAIAQTELQPGNGLAYRGIGVRFSVGMKVKNVRYSRRCL